jgi:hypothetical protein
MAYIEYDEEIASDLGGADIQAVARRQFSASVAVAIVILAGVGFAAMMPSSHDRSEAAMPKTTIVQQPTFVNSTGRFAAAVQRPIELP